MNPLTKLWVSRVFGCCEGNNVSDLRRLCHAGFNPLVMIGARKRIMAGLGAFTDLSCVLIFALGPRSSATADAAVRSIRVLGYAR